MVRRSVYFRNTGGSYRRQTRGRSGQQFRWGPAAVRLMRAMGWLWGARTPGVTTVSISICPVSFQIVAAIRSNPLKRRVVFG